MTPLFKKFLGLNWVLLINMAALIIFGVYAIRNAGAFRMDGLDTKWSQQIQWAIIGIPVFFCAALIDYKWVRWGCVFFYAAGIAGLLLLQKYGIEVLGQKRLRLPNGMEIQTSAVAITGGIFVLATVFGHIQRWLPIFRYPSLRLILACILAGIPAVLVLEEDFGSASVWGPVFCAMLLVGGIPFRYLITMLLLVLCVAPIGYFFALKPYQQARLDSFFYLLTNQTEKVDLRAEGWVPNFLQISVGSAGFNGKGAVLNEPPDGRSAHVHHTFFPEESINDFIFATIAEDFGFRGSVLLLSGMLLLLLQAMFIAFYARDQLGRLIVVGSAAMLFTHAFENAGMNIILMPITGLPFPFVSYGGSFLVVCMFLMGVMQSVWVHRNISPVKKGEKDEPED